MRVVYYFVDLVVSTALALMLLFGCGLLMYCGYCTYNALVRALEYAF